MAWRGTAVRTHALVRTLFDDYDACDTMRCDATRYSVLYDYIFFLLLFFLSHLLRISYSFPSPSPALESTHAGKITPKYITPIKKQERISESKHNIPDETASQWRKTERKWKEKVDGLIWYGIKT